MHQEGLDVGEMRSQLVEGREAERIDVAPVMDAAVRQPFGLGERGIRYLDKPGGLLELGVVANCSLRLLQCVKRGAFGRERKIRGKLGELCPADSVSEYFGYAAA